MLLEAVYLASALLLAGVLMSEGALLARIAQGEHTAFKHCMDRYGDMIWSLARRLSPTPSDAEDATQDVFLHLWKNARHYDAARGSEAVFILTLARRTLIGRFRGRQRQPSAVPIDDLNDGAAELSAPANDEMCAEAHLAAQVLATLPPDQVRVIRMSVVQGLSQSEIAQQTGLPLGTVKTAMRRGLIEVRARLGLGVAAAHTGAQ